MSSAWPAIAPLPARLHWLCRILHSMPYPWHHGCGFAAAARVPKYLWNSLRYSLPPPLHGAMSTSRRCCSPRLEARRPRPASSYDFIILNQPMRERDAELLEELRDVFCTFIADEYPDVAIHDVVKLAASHYFGIVPLHNNRKHQLAYLDTCRALLSSIPPSV